MSVDRKALGAAYAVLVERGAPLPFTADLEAAIDAYHSVMKCSAPMETKSASDDWTPWDGIGTPNLSNDTNIEARLRNGLTVTGAARHMSWSHRDIDEHRDIVRYRVCP